MAETLLEFMLRRLEKFPSSKFDGSELKGRDAGEFDHLRKSQLLRFVQDRPQCSLAPCPTKSVCEAPGRDVVPSQGKWWGVCSCPANEAPVEIHVDDLHRFEFVLPAFVLALREFNKLAGQHAQLCERTFLVGETILGEDAIAVVFALLDQRPQSIVILEALFSRLPSTFTRIVVLTPSFQPGPTDAVRLEGRRIVVVSRVVATDFVLMADGVLSLPMSQRSDSPSTWPDEYFKDEDGTWLNAPILAERFGIPDSRLKDWRDSGCPSLDGRKLAAKRVGKIGWVYFRMDVNQISNRRDDQGRIDKTLDIQARLKAASTLKRGDVATEDDDSR